jgi:hypothetical protein
VTPALLDAPARLFAESALETPDGGHVTLEERLRRTWRALETQGVSECPLCRSRMSKAGPVAECTSCGTRLS